MARSDSTGRDLQQKDVAAQQRLAQAVQDDGGARATNIAGMSLSYGDAETILRTVSHERPLPVFIGDGTDILGVLGDGDTVVRLIADTVGTTKGIVIFGADAGNIARLLLTDEFGRTAATDMRTHDLLEQTVTLLKVMVAHLSEMTGAEISADDVEID